MTSTSPPWPAQASVFSFLPATAAPAPGLTALRTIPDPCRWSLRLTIQTLPRSVGPVFTSAPPPAQSAAKVPGSMAAVASAGFLHAQAGRAELGSQRVLIDWYRT